MNSTHQSMADPATANMLDDNSPSLHYGARVESEISREYIEPSSYDLDTYRIVFELFDRDGNGYIEADDLAVISSKLGRDPQEGNVLFFLMTLFSIRNYKAI
jgi:hypothetical protein